MHKQSGGRWIVAVIAGCLCLAANGALLLMHLASIENNILTFLIEISRFVIYLALLFPMPRTWKRRQILVWASVLGVAVESAVMFSFYLDSKRTLSDLVTVPTTVFLSMQFIVLLGALIALRYKEAPQRFWLERVLTAIAFLGCAVAVVMLLDYQNHFVFPVLKFADYLGLIALLLTWPVLRKPVFRKST